MLLQFTATADNPTVDYGEIVWTDGDIHEVDGGVAQQAMSLWFDNFKPTDKDEKSEPIVADPDTIENED